jgi:hypothetical protein
MGLLNKVLVKDLPKQLLSEQPVSGLIYEPDASYIRGRSVIHSVTFQFQYPTNTIPTPNST